MLLLLPVVSWLSAAKKNLNIPRVIWHQYRNGIEKTLYLSRQAKLYVVLPNKRISTDNNGGKNIANKMRTTQPN